MPSDAPLTRSPTTPRSSNSSKPSTKTSTRPTTPPAADRLGVVYTPNEIVDFIIRGTDHLLQKHFGRTLADDNVQILDPATGTGTFITSLIDYLPADRLEHKYLNEIHANEVAILPYYIANLNIEYSFREKTGDYVEFPNLVFVDTLDNLGWQGSTKGGVRRQGTFELGALSFDNWYRMHSQNEKTISVILGNPPYNAHQTNYNEFNPNRAYPAIDQRIKESYVAESSAQKTKQYDMYKRFLRWASDRLGEDGVVAFITNRSYLDKQQDDGFRKIIAQEFSDIYVVDLGGDIRGNSKTGNVFGIMTGVAIGFFVRLPNNKGTGKIHYLALDDGASGAEKLEELSDLELEGVTFQDIAPDAKNNWLNQSTPEFEILTPLVNENSTRATSNQNKWPIFNLRSLGVSTNRDEWVYDFDSTNLEAKSRFFADEYNKLLENNDTTLSTSLKWSSTMRSRFQRGRRINYRKGSHIEGLYRPFVNKYYFADPVMNDRLTRNHYYMFGTDLQQTNQVICFQTRGGRRTFAALASDTIPDLHLFFDGAQCLPLYRYTSDGDRISNIAQRAIQQINDHYRVEWGDGYDRLTDQDGITAEDIFAYTYAVLHDPKYREAYAVDLLQEFPRLPLHHDFYEWSRLGRELLDFHVGFESVSPWSIDRMDVGPRLRGLGGSKPILRADIDRGTIVLDNQTTLTGIPDSAWQYRLGSRSALEWVLDQYKERKPRDPTIRERFNTYRFADHKERVIDLLQRVCTVSVETVRIVDQLADLSEIEPVAS